MLEQRINRGVAGEALDESKSGAGVLFAGFEEGLHHLEVRYEVREGVTGEVLPARWRRNRVAYPLSNEAE